MNDEDERRLFSMPCFFLYLTTIVAIAAPIKRILPARAIITNIIVFSALTTLGVVSVTVSYEEKNCI